MKTTFYVQLEPRWRSYRDYQTKRYPLEGVVATRVTKEKPKKPAAQSITVKLTMDIPNSVFEPFEPAVEIVIPEAQMQDLIKINVLPAEEDEDGRGEVSLRDDSTD